MEQKNAKMNTSFADGKGLDMSLFWQGEGHNDNAALTIFRHFDSATVVKGFVGQAPKTMWVLDYSLFERIHYLLVAGFDVYGNVGPSAYNAIVYGLFTYGRRAKLLGVFTT